MDSKTKSSKGVLKNKFRIKANTAKKIDIEHKEKIKKKSLELEKKFIEEEIIPEKIIIQNEMSYMRKKLSKDKKNINITYPVDPPYAFINIVFDKKDGEFQYLVKEPILENEEKKILDNIKEKVEDTMDHQEIPIDDTISFSKSEKLDIYLKK